MLVETRKQIKFPNKKYRIIYADPPWPESAASEKRFGQAEQHFKTMKEREIVSLGGAINGIAHANSALFLWSTARHLPMAFRVMEAWGYRYVNVAFTWMKSNKNDGRPRMGLGVYTKANAEFCLLGLRGKMKAKAHNVLSAVYEPTVALGWKPNTVRDRIVRLFGNLSRIELFARQRIKGWDAWGDEV